MVDVLFFSLMLSKVLCLRQNSFLRKHWNLTFHVIVCINKIDRPEARPDEVVDEVLELLMDLGAF